MQRVYQSLGIFFLTEGNGENLEQEACVHFKKSGIVLEFPI